MDIELRNNRLIQFSGCIYQTADRCSGDTMFLRHFGQAHSRAAITDDLLSVDIQRSTTDSPAFQFRSTHSCQNSFPHKV